MFSLKRGARITWSAEALVHVGWKRVSGAAVIRPFRIASFRTSMILGVTFSSRSYFWSLIKVLVSQTFFCKVYCYYFLFCKCTVYLLFLPEKQMHISWTTSWHFNSTFLIDQYDFTLLLFCTIYLSGFSVVVISLNVGGGV